MRVKVRDIIVKEMKKKHTPERMRKYRIREKEEREREREREKRDKREKVMKEMREK